MSSLPSSAFQAHGSPASLASRTCYGLAAPGRGERLFPWAFERRALRPDDIAVSIRFCGVCHSDLHASRGAGPFPLVPGHEIVGEVTAVGSAVTRFKPGDKALVGTIVGSCGECEPCKKPHAAVLPPGRHHHLRRQGPP